MRPSWATTSAVEPVVPWSRARTAVTRTLPRSQLCQTGAGRFESRPELRICIPPRGNDPTVVRHRAIALARSIEGPGEHLVQLRVGDVEVRGVEGTTERRLHHGDGIPWPAKRHQNTRQFKVGARIAIGERPHCLTEFPGGQCRATAR